MLFLYWYSISQENQNFCHPTIQPNTGLSAYSGFENKSKFLAFEAYTWLFRLSLHVLQITQVFGNI